MTKIYLIRHAEAEGNYYRRIQGQWDGGITSLGYKQIDALAERMKDVHLDALYSSDLTRTKLTAGAIQKYHDLPLRTDKNLREVRMGQWEGMSWGDVIHADPEQYGFFSNDPGRWTIEGGERWEALCARIYGTITRIASKHDGETIAIVSHGTAIRALLCKVMGVSSKDIHTVPHGDNTCVTLLDVSGDNIKIEYACDNSHLDEDCSTFAKQTWWKTGVDHSNLRFRPLDLQKEGKFYLRCYADAWRSVHGDTEGFIPALYLMSAKRWMEDCPESIMVALENDEIVGLVALDTYRGTEDATGWIAFLYVLPQFRGKRYASQLLGYAMTLYTRMERKAIALHVSEDNPNAIGFYEHLGFKQVGEDVGIGAPLKLMDKPLGRGLLPL